MLFLCVAPPGRCDRCDNRIETGEWYPIAKERGADGDLRLYSFCSEGCKRTWLADGTTGEG